MSDAAESLEERIAAHFGPADVSESVEQEQSQTEDTEQSEEALAAETDSETPEETSAEFEEVEFEGKKYQVPTELKEALMARSDYTAKTTETARLKEALTLQQQEVALFNEQRLFEQSVADDFEQLKLLDAYIQHEKTNTDWSQLSTDQIVRKRLEIDQLQEQRSGLADVLQKKRAEFNQKVADERNKLNESSKELLAKAIPNWNDEVKGDIEKSLADRGYPDIAVKNMSALDYQVAWEAMQYRKLQQGKAAALKNAAHTPPVVRPGASNPMSQDVKEKLKFKKQMDKAREQKLPEAQKARIIQERIEQKLRRLS